MMEVKIGNYGNIIIGHKTLMGKVSDLMAIGNLIREIKGLQPKDLQVFLRRQSTWEFIAETQVIFNQEEAMKSNDSNSVLTTQLDSIDFKGFLDNAGQVAYKPLMTQFPDVIQSKRGKYGGTWMHLNLMLKLAMWLDPELEARVIHTFVTQNILADRVERGESLNDLNKLIDTLPDRSPSLKPKGNKKCYTTIAKMIRQKLELESTGCNEEGQDLPLQKRRKEIIEACCAMIEIGVIKSYKQLKLMVVKL